MNHDKLPFIWRPNLTRVFSDRYHPTIYRPPRPNGAGSRKHRPLVETHPVSQIGMPPSDSEADDDDPLPTASTVDDLFTYLRAYHAENDHFPSFQQIAKHFGWVSGSTVRQHMRALVKIGLLAAITPGFSDHTFYRFVQPPQIPQTTANGA